MKQPTTEHENEPTAETLSSRTLLRHYVEKLPQTTQSIDQLANFLTGVGVVALGYLMQQPLADVVAIAREGAPAAVGVLGCWGAAVLLLLYFLYLYIFRALAARSVHARHGDMSQVGRVMSGRVPDSFPRFFRGCDSYALFLREHFHSGCSDGESLWFAHLQYNRYMLMRKIRVMAVMRRALAAALVLAVAYRVGLMLVV